MPFIKWYKMEKIVNFLHFKPLDKGHVPENLWKLSVT